jgi:signal transduction histidine kinase
MRPLPLLAVGERQWILPLADRSAVALAEHLITDSDSGRSEVLAVALASDPSLLLWTICAFSRREDFLPRSISDVALWLSRHALQVLQWSEIPSSQNPIYSEEDLGSLVAASFSVADLAVPLVAGQGQAAVELAALLGLLHNASAWLGSISHAPLTEVGKLLPAWLVHPSQPDMPVAEAVQTAIGILAGNAVQRDGNLLDLAATRQKAAELSRQWLAPMAGVPDLLPRLAAKLARYAELQSRFEETLEREKLEAMAEFAAGAGHEINNPLTVIAGRAQLFLRSETDPERRRALALMNAQAMRVYEMIADMRLFARPPRPELQLVNIAALIDGAIADLVARAAQQETIITRRGESNPVEIKADPVQLNVVVRAICQNAMEAIGSGGRVEIALRHDDREVQIQISDDGPGITPEQRRHLFDPFYSARQAGRGLGLGLSKSWRIITNHGGRIEVASLPPHGASFTITLPKKSLNL